MGIDQPIFENAGQAVHVAFLVMAQEAIQDAPLRMALIRIMESIKLENGNQRNWLDQLRGTASGSVNFEGLSSGEVRAQCAMITQAVRTKLPDQERWVLQAKFGQSEFEDVAGGVDTAGAAALALATADEAAETARVVQRAARDEFERVVAGGVRGTYRAARDALDAANVQVDATESTLEQLRVAQGKAGSCRQIDNGPMPKVKGLGVTRRYAFSAERVDAIKGLGDYFAPQFPRIKPLAIDCMLGRLFANHKKLDISTRDLAKQFGGSDTKYLRASWKMKNQLRIIEASALERLAPLFIENGVIADFQ